MALVRSGSGASVLIVLGDHWRILQPSAAGYWNRRWPLDRCGDPPLDIRLASTRRSAGSQCVHAPSARSRTDSMDRALNYRGICEETIFRGYPQQQFMALTKSASVGILVSAATFGGLTRIRDSG